MADFHMPSVAPGPAAGAEWAGSGHTTFPDHLPTVAALLRHACDHHRDNLAVATPDARLTYDELDRRSARMAALLVARGVVKGTKVGILLPNGADWVVTWAAVTRIGGVAVPVNTFSTTPEMATMLRHADVQVLVMCRSFGHHDYVEQLTAIAPELERASAAESLLLRSLPQLRHVLLWGDGDGDGEGGGENGGESPDGRVAWTEPIVDLPAPVGNLASVVLAMEDDVVPADPMLITYTSGSTGEPKGVVHGHGPLLRHGRNLAAMSGIGPDDRIWTPMPLFWVGGFAFTLLRALSVGAAFVTQDRMDAGVALELLARERVSCVSAWPAIGATLTAHPEYERTDLSALRLGTFYEGRVRDSRPVDPGLCVTSLGMSETAGPHTFWTAEEDRIGSPEQFRGAFGHQIPGMSHRIVDADGNDVAEGVEGQVLVRGYSLMLGLHKRERHEVFDPDGWYRTDDRGYFDGGWFFFTGRNSDLIKTKGANVAPSEVEPALVGLDGVRSAFVFGVDHDVDGQQVVALVVVDDHATEHRVTPEALVPQLRELLSSYKVPSRIFAIEADEVPYLTSQKPDRRALAALATKLAGSGD
jgi:acyl-CoA synthetase (AMP-forming)/AMP-acid ligase II